MQQILDSFALADENLLGFLGKWQLWDTTPQSGTPQRIGMWNEWLSGRKFVSFPIRCDVVETGHTFREISLLVKGVAT
jgi:hypothetical protein